MPIRDITQSKLHRLLLAACTLWLGVSPAHATLREGKVLYSQAQYDEAARVLTHTVKQQPKNQLAYYFLGNSLLRVQDYQEAKRAYDACFRLDPFSEAGQYSRKALLYLANVDDGLQPTKKLYVDCPPHVQQAINQLNEELRSRRDFINRIGRGQATLALQNWNLRVSKLDQEVDSEKKLLSSRRIPVSDEWEYAMRLKRAQLLSAGRREADARAKIAAKREEELERTAINLQHLMAEPSRPGHPKLRAAGSNLYVRHYGSEQIIPIAPMLATAKALDPQAFKPQRKPAQK